MCNKTIDDIFDGLKKHPVFHDDPDLRLDHYGYLIERQSYGASHSFGWRVTAQGWVIGNVVGTRPLMG